MPDKRRGNGSCTVIDYVSMLGLEKARGRSGDTLRHALDPSLEFISTPFIFPTVTVKCLHDRCDGMSK